jgi:hypothetical protein
MASKLAGISLAAVPACGEGFGARLVSFIVPAGA